MSDINLLHFADVAWWTTASETDRISIIWMLFKFWVQKWNLD